MKPFYLDCNLVGVPSEDLGSAVQMVFQQLEDQSQSAAEAITSEQHGVQPGGDLHAVATSESNGFMSVAMVTQLAHYQGDTSDAGPASLTQFPSDGDWGFHTDTSGSTYSLAKNKGGTIYTTLLT